MTSLFPDMVARDDRSAIISPCGRYRYRLDRRWGDGPIVMWLMLNPSVADAIRDDATLRRIIDYSRRWGYAGLCVGNLFALRSTDPMGLYCRRKDDDDPVGPENDGHLVLMVAESAMIIAAWGNHGSLMGRDKIVRTRFPGMRALGFTKEGQPVHPLRQRADLTPIDWS
jgi:hypothetical protein